MPNLQIMSCLFAKLSRVSRLTSMAKVSTLLGFKLPGCRMEAWCHGAKTRLDALGLGPSRSQCLSQIVVFFQRYMC